MVSRLLGVLLLSTVSTLADSAPFRVVAQDQRDHATLQLSDSVLTLDIQSHDGIGRLRLERLGPSWPDTIRIRLNITELEGFSLESEGAATLEVSRKHPGPLLINREKQGVTVQIPREALPPVGVRLLDVQWIDYYR